MYQNQAWAKLLKLILFNSFGLDVLDFLHTDYLLPLHRTGSRTPEVNTKSCEETCFFVLFVGLSAYYLQKMAKAKRTAKKAPSKDRINKSGHSMNPGNGYEHRIESCRRIFW